MTKKDETMVDMRISTDVEDANYLDSRTKEERESETPGSITVSTDNEDWQFIGAAMEEVLEKETEEKFGLEMLQVGPVSFAELNAVREAQKQDLGVKQVVSDFMSLVGNVMSFPSEKGKAADIKRLVKEMDGLLPVEDEEDEKKPGKKKKEHSAEMEKRPQRLFTIWKDEATGEYRWLGVYSNKFRDSDTPAEILAEDAHLRFIDRVEKAELPYPDLYVWHIPVPVGKADLLAYDNSGFSIASGVIKEAFAVALMNTSEDLAMSHGMPAQHIRRDDVDKTVITDYVSSEVSVLPRFAAANKMTDFYVLDEEEAKMAIIPDKKRQQVSSLLGPELTEQLEAGLVANSSKALAEGVEFKEEAQPVEETEKETDEQKTDQLEVPAVVEALVAEVEGVAVDATDESEADVAEEAAAEEEEAAAEVEDVQETDETPLNKAELAETLSYIVTALSEQNTQILEAVKGIADRVETLEGDNAELKEDDATKIAKLAAGTSEASLVELMAAQLAGGAKTIIGNPVSRVHGNSALAKEAPEQTSHDESETKEGYAGLFFSNWQQ